MNLGIWAQKWGVTPDALTELRRLMGVPAGLSPVPTEGGASESRVQSLVRLEASEKGILLMRNNVGAGTLQNGSFVRWGLCNDSKAMNQSLKSHDLIGIKPVLIKPQHVGHTFGQFVARECKPEGWTYSDRRDRDRAQLRFAELINSLGGDACFVTGRGSL